MLFGKNSKTKLAKDFDEPQTQATALPRKLLNKMAVYPNASGNLHLLITVLFFLNIVNLLPVMPLDGGQIVQLTISSRYPTVQFGLQVLSCCVALCIGVAIKDPILIFLAAFIAVGLPTSYRNINILKTTQNIEPIGDKQHFVEKAFSALSDTSTKFGTRYNQVQMIVSLPNRHKESPLLTGATVLIYTVTLLFMPIGLLGPLFT